MRPADYQPSEYDQARQERADDFRRFNDNEARMEREHYATEAEEADRLERVARYERILNGGK